MKAMPLRHVLVALLCVGAMAACSSDTSPAASDPDSAGSPGFSYTGARGETVELDAVPQRIVVGESAASALIPFGIRPVGIWGGSSPEESVALQGLDLSGIESVGQTFGEINIEKVAALDPDLIIAGYYPLEKQIGGLNPGDTTTVERLEQIAGFPITINHKYGSTEITKAPERVVAVGLTEQDTLLALGVTPVATREWFGEQPGALWPWARDRASGTTPEVLAYELNYEKIAALRPDLILGVVWGVTEEEYPKLSQIAPTVAQSADFVDGGTPWQDQTRIIGRALGQEQRAGELVAAVEAKFAESRRANPQFAGATAVAAYDFGDGQLGIYGPQDPRARILTSLGFEVPPRIVELVGDEFFATISNEQLELVEADAVVWIGYTEAGASRIQDQPLYRTLDVAREGRDIFLVGTDPVGAAYAFSSVLSLPVALDGLAPQLAAAVDGDPATTVGQR